MVPGPDAVSIFSRGRSLQPRLLLLVFLVGHSPAVQGLSRQYDRRMDTPLDYGQGYENAPPLFPFQNYRHPNRFDMRLNTNDDPVTDDRYMMNPGLMMINEAADESGPMEPAPPNSDDPYQPMHNQPVFDSQPGDAPPPVQQDFPQLTLRQKQFAVHPGLQEFHQDNPNFLNFRLQELEEAQDFNNFKNMLPSEQESPQVEAKRARMGVASHLRWDDYVEETKENDLYFTVGVAASTAFAVFVLVGTGYCFQRRMRRWKDSEEVEYPSYGVTGPAKDASPAADRKLAQSAQMYHYQHQKSQMIGSGTVADEQSDGGDETEGEDGEGDYTVYECPGLASTDEMEVKNPLFDYDPTPKP